MDELYGGVHSSSAHDYADKALMSPDGFVTIFPTEYSNYHNNLVSDHHHHHQNHHHGAPIIYPSQLGGGSDINTISSIASEKVSITREHEFQRVCRRENNDFLDGVNDEGYTLIKTKIASHPSYPKLLNSYIDCQKVGAPPDIASWLDEIRLENDRNAVTTCYGVDPELDEFMESYCQILMKYKLDLSRPFGEATTFIKKMEIQLGNLCKDDGGLSSDDEVSGGETELHGNEPMRSEDKELKDRLLEKYGSHITTLKLEFSKKKKKGKLPREARQTLLEWWNVHIKWPYPTVSSLPLSHKLLHG